jgi:tripartite-type tricarboxylate transporter receptor subunit TctC
LLADRLTKKWDQPIVIENRPGGDVSSSFIGHAYQHHNLPYKPDDLAPIARVSNTVIGISVPMDLPVRTLRDVVELASTKPGQLNWAGLTGALDIMFEGWLKSIGVDMKKVPYRNPVEALAVTNTARASAIPDIPTVAEAGYPALTMDGLVGLFGPRNYAERSTWIFRAADGAL